MILKTDLRLSRKVRSDGFGFVCMKTAYDLCIRGRLEFFPEGEIRIEAEGEERQIYDFIEWIKEATGNSIISQVSTSIPGRKYNEFDIFSH